MSKPEQSLNKAIAYVIIAFVAIAAILAVIMFSPYRGSKRSLFETSLRYYTRGTEKLYYTEYAQTIIQNFREIGIEVADYSTEYSVFIDKVVETKDYDLAILEVEGESTPFLDLFFKEGAFLNIFNLRNNLDNGTTAEYLKNITRELDFHTRRNLLYDFQEHLMSNLLPMVPLFTPARTFSYWDNLNGFSAELGISMSLPYMTFNGLHDGQTTTQHLKIGVGKWFDLNPLTVSEPAEKTIISLMMDKLIEVDEKGNPTDRGLIDTWEYVNQTTILLHVRNNVKWQPDQEGLFTDSYFTVDDLLFTIDLLRSDISNRNYELYKWIKSYDAYNATTITLYVDSDPTTTENDPYAFILESLSVYPLPDHYLNVAGTVEEIVNSARWGNYAQSPFGTGKYIYNATDSQVDLTAILQRFDEWHGIGFLPGVSTNLAFSKIEAQTYDDSYAMTLELQEGSRIDLADFGRDPAMEDSLQTNEFETQFAVDNSLVFLAFNLDDENFGGEKNFEPTNQTGISKGLAIRKAIASIVDKTFMNSAYHKGKFNITNSPVSQYFKDYYHPSVTTYPFSVEEALYYLDLAGFNISTPEENPTEESSFNLIGTIGAIGISAIIMIIVRSRKRRSDRK
ncbi:MAG: ABC transporter substrate-binding protein [Candidatus Heimdallarchaeaceae archaeon]|jgi:ABC-type transport system substrate-binding protein